MTTRTFIENSTVLRRLGRDQGAVAMIEFAFVLPIFVVMCLGGTELANYITARMRVSQIALHIADNAARIGSGSPLAAKTITETDINDVFVGSQLQSSGLNLGANGRVILSDLEPTANPNTAGTYKIVWQRCFGSKTHASSYGLAGAINLSGIGPAGRQATAQDDNATMFVEVYYEYRPLIAAWAPSTTMTEIASMSVRDRRDLAGGIQNTEGAPISSC